MAKVKTKGSQLQLDIAGVYTAVAQVVSISGPEAEVETWESTTLDTVGPGKEYEATGYVEAGEVSFPILFDPALAGHRLLTARITTPQKDNWKIVFTDAAATEHPFSAIFTGFGTAVEMSDGLKADCKMKLSGIPTYPT